MNCMHIIKLHFLYFIVALTLQYNKHKVRKFLTFFQKTININS
jgi:hypothetical protein